MTVHPLAGKPAPASLRIDVGQLEREYHERCPDGGDVRQLVSFGTSGHRGTTLDGTFTEAHILAITQAICDYRRAQKNEGPICMGKDTHALSSPPCRGLGTTAAHSRPTTPISSWTARWTRSRTRPGWRATSAPSPGSWERGFSWDGRRSAGRGRQGLSGHRGVAPRLTGDSPQRGSDQS
jgi:hypothetical protein